MAMQLRFDVAHSPSLPEDVRARPTNEGELVIEAKRFRSQERNCEDAIGRLEGKKQRGEIKRGRGAVSE